MMLQGMSLYKFGRGRGYFSRRLRAGTLQRVPKRCLLFEVGLAHGPPLYRIDQDNFAYGLFEGNSMSSALLGFRFSGSCPNKGQSVSLSSPSPLRVPSMS